MTLQEKMTEYRRAKVACDAMEAEIKEEVANRAATTATQGISAVYNPGSKSFKYELAGREHATPDVVERCTKQKVDWKLVCKESGLQNITFNQGKPRVSIRIEKDSTPFPEA